MSWRLGWKKDRIGSAQSWRKGLARAARLTSAGRRGSAWSRRARGVRVRRAARVGFGLGPTGGRRSAETRVLLHGWRRAADAVDCCGSVTWQCAASRSGWRLRTMGLGGSATRLQLLSLGSMRRGAGTGVTRLRATAGVRRLDLT